MNRTSETEFIFALFHLLLACLGLLIVLSWLRKRLAGLSRRAQSLLAAGFALFALQFGLTTYYLADDFFFGRLWNRVLFLEIAQALEGAACLHVSAGLFLLFKPASFQRAIRWVIAGLVAISLVLLLDGMLASGALTPPNNAFHPWAVSAIALVSAAALGRTALLLIRLAERSAHLSVLALVLLFSSVALHQIHLYWNSRWSAVGWHIEQHLVSFGLVAFAWALGERSANLFDRVFVRLNLTFIVLASVMILSTVGMERVQYAKLTEERSLSLAEFLRGHLTYYRGKGEDLDTILQHAEVLRRIVVGFGELPDFRRLEIFLGGEHAVFFYHPDRTMTEEITARTRSAPEIQQLAANEELPAVTTFQMVHLPVHSEHGSGDWIEFYGGMEHLNQHLGSYIVVIYSLFTIMVGASVVVVGIIVRNADQSIQKQHAEIEGIERQLAQAAKLASIGELAGGVAHEINNPVTGILSMATHLVTKRRDTGLTDRDRQDLELIAREAQRITDIVMKLLTFSHQSRMEFVFADVNTIVENAISLVQLRLRNTRIVLKRELARGLPRILCDLNRLAEVFVNLMNNAIDAMPLGGVLTIRSEGADAGMVRVAISDTGTGIEAAELDRIFDPFFTTKEPGKGTGLGLSISHAIVKGHGGEIQVKTAPGQGSTFSVILPEGTQLHAEAHSGGG
ncbi:MAG: hypothetical protein HYZ57_18825 [Acidobacteria bacterium]|nr:hypothetical protein [Acidobacteriota bacterium]